MDKQAIEEAQRRLSEWLADLSELEKAKGTKERGETDGIKGQI
ncbi:MAG TPA: hypothetical protein VHD36_10315 [Pirellulales bacterium]|nr:hypothetical protein [Pirellulales bacterium]